MKRTFIGTFEQCMIVVRKSEKLNKSRKYGKDSGYSHYELDQVDEQHAAEAKRQWIYRYYKSYRLGNTRYKQRNEPLCVLTLYR